MVRTLPLSRTLREPEWVQELRRDRAINVWGVPGPIAAALILLVVIAICWVMFKGFAAVSRRIESAGR